jgi:gas vesicle protein
MDNQESSFIGILSAFVIGGLIGAGIMALIAPQSGSETRDLLMSKGQDFRDNALETTSKTGKMVGDITQQAVDRATNVLRRGKEMGDGYKSNVEEEAKSKSVQFGK